MPSSGSSLVSEFHKRAGDSHAEARKLLTGLAVGTLGVFYATLAGTDGPALDVEGTLLAFWTIVLMAASAGFGLAAWRADAAWAYRAAKEFERCPGLTAPYRGFAHTVKRVCDMAQLVFFVVGLLTAVLLMLPMLG